MFTASENASPIENEAIVLEFLKSFLENPARTPQQLRKLVEYVFEFELTPAHFFQLRCPKSGLSLLAVVLLNIDFLRNEETDDSGLTTQLYQRLIDTYVKPSADFHAALIRDITPTVVDGEQMPERDTVAQNGLSLIIQTISAEQCRAQQPYYPLLTPKTPHTLDRLLLDDNYLYRFGDN